MRIATLFAIFALLGLVAGASASTGNMWNKDTVPEGVYYDSGRIEGDTIEEAWLIADIPFQGFDDTCAFNNDYDEQCPYTGSTSGDVVYAYTPGEDVSVDIDLCFSQYDTKVYVYQDYWTPGSPYACNDDFHFTSPCYTFSSKIECLDLFAGHTYYIVVDGYYGSCGYYQLDVTECGGGCELECPDGALIEGEPTCQDEYYDAYNSGCNNPEMVWSLIEAQGGTDCATMCGLSCTYYYGGSSYRDTDWYEICCVGGPVIATVNAEFTVQFILIYGIDCNNLQYDLVTSIPCVPVTLTYNATAGQILWLWVGPTSFGSGVPESLYILDVCGITQPFTPVSESTWGSIKGMFK